jgi:hypothetical protein
LTVKPNLSIGAVRKISDLKYFAVSNNDDIKMYGSGLKKCHESNIKILKTQRVLVLASDFCGLLLRLGHDRNASIRAGGCIIFSSSSRHNRETSVIKKIEN